MHTTRPTSDASPPSASPARSIAALSRLDGRVALITGGGGEIGATIADALAECGAGIAVVDVDEERARAVTQGIAARHDSGVLALGVDLREDQALRAIPHTVRDRLGPIDVLVNCAAMVPATAMPGWTCDFEEQSLATWRDAMEVNLTAAFALTQVCADDLRRGGVGSVINIGSIYGVVGPDLSMYRGTDMGSAAAYAASKGGLTQLTRWLATVLAPDVRVNTLSCGGVSRGQPQAFQRRYHQRTPLGRMANAEDFKGAAVYLASDLAAYVTGQNLLVDGGWSAW